MGRTLLRLSLLALVSVALLYVSRFWPVELWSQRSVLADLGLRPGGGLLKVWLRGTPLAPFDLLLWAVLSFLALSGTEALSQRLGRTSKR